ncbi:uncharacterized protein At4g18490 [Punica granatum]|uniref:Uncharacterized protein At4g18490 n=1 Tax=Punica granatum TaxID=22663 RepID=A0A6P8E0A5_PUNGR|nr:uncharacterized protein At4g18490 [Punica granatum]
MTRQMAEPEKESSSVQSKSKKGLLDEEIGKEFLSSWKSMSVTEDDGMDFSFETIGKGKKNAFNFDKLDMDFNLDGDFSKLSTFKVDMPDIDFSCLPEETAKPKEGNAEESSVRNGERKKETFSFSFGFNGMDNFDFDSGFTKGVKTPKKDLMTKEVASVKLNDQGTNIHLSGDFAVYDDDGKKLPAMMSMEASQEVGIGAKHTSLRTNSLGSATFRVKALQNEERACLDTQMGGSPEESDQQGDLLEKSVQTRLYVQNEDTMTQKSGSVVPKEACSLVKVPDSHTGNDQNICDNMVNEDVPYPGNLQSMDPCASDSAKSVNDAKRNLLDIGTYSDCMGSSEHDQGQLDIEDAATSNVSKKTLGDTKFEKQDENLVKKLDLATVNREAAANKMMPTNNKESGRVCSKFFKRLRDTGNSDAEPRLIQLGSKKVGGINTNSADEMREGSCKDTWLETKLDNNVAGISRIGSSRNKSGSSSNSSSSTETSKTPGSQACVDPERTGLSTEAPGSTRIMSLDRKKLHSINATTTRNLSSLSIKRAPGSAVEQPASRPLAGATSTKAPEEVTQSQRNSGKLIPLPGGNPEKEKQLTLTSSLKRKTYETASTNTMSCSPLKRLSESPVQSRSCKEASPKLVVSGQMKEVSVFFENKGDVKSRNSLDDSSPQVEISRVKNMVDYEFTALVENDGNVEEAEAYTKELEDLCNMLKKKQDEAKELLVRAIVNNNHLLMLNHPIFEEKIRSVQKFASELMATQTGNRDH